MCAENSIEFVDRGIIACSSKWRHLGMQLLPRPGYEKKNALTGGRWEGCGKRNISRTHLNGRAAWGMLRSARRDSGGWWFTAFFHAVYVVVECSRVSPLPPPTEPHYYYYCYQPAPAPQDRRRGNDCLLSHSVSRWRSLSRGYFGPPLAGRPENVHSRNLVAAERHSM